MSMFFIVIVWLKFPNSISSVFLMSTALSSASIFAQRYDGVGLQKENERAARLLLEKELITITCNYLLQKVINS